MAKAQKKPDPLDELAAGPLEQIIALMLWQARHRNPELTCILKAQDIAGLKDCCDYLKVQPSIAVLRPPGRPATPAVPPRGTRPGIPAQPAEPPRPHVVVALVAKGTMDAITPLENNDEDAEIAQREKGLRRWREKAGVLALQASSMAQTGDTSSAVLNEIAECLQAFATAS